MTSLEERVARIEEKLAYLSESNERLEKKVDEIMTRVEFFIGSYSELRDLWKKRNGLQTRYVMGLVALVVSIWEILKKLFGFLS